MARGYKISDKGNPFVRNVEPDNHRLASSGNYDLLDAYRPTSRSLNIKAHTYTILSEGASSCLMRSLCNESVARAWAARSSDNYKPFVKPETSRVAVKVFSHLGEGALWL